MTMKRMQRAMGAFSGGCAEFFWVYSLALFLTYAIEGRGLPVAVCFIIFWGAVTITSLVKNGRLYRIIIVLLYAILFMISMQWLFSIYFQPVKGYSQAPYGPFYWIALLQKANNFTEYLPFIAIGISLILLWFSGIYFSMKRINFQGSLKTLESGVVAFFSIILLQIGLVQETPGINLYLLLFFVWVVLAIMLNKTSHWGNEKDKGIRLFRWIFTFVSSMFLVIITIITFFTDTLKWLAEAGISAAKTIAAPFAPFLTSFVRFLFGRRGGIGNQSSSSSSFTNAETVGEYANGSSLFGKIMEKVFLFVVVLLVLILLISILREISKFLFSKKGKAFDRNQKTLKQFVLSVLGAIIAFFTYLFKNIKSIVLIWSRKDKPIVKVYKHLIRWGTIHGVYHEVYETPLEYAQKLTLKYAHYQEVFKQIITAYYKEIYGEKQLSSGEIAQAKKNLRGLFSFGGMGSLI